MVSPSNVRARAGAGGAIFVPCTKVNASRYRYVCRLLLAVSGEIKSQSHMACRNLGAPRDVHSTKFVVKMLARDAAEAVYATLDAVHRAAGPMTLEVAQPKAATF